MRDESSVSADVLEELRLVDARAFDVPADERERELPAPEERALPGGGFLWVAVGCRELERCVAHAREVGRQRGSGVRRGLGRAQDRCRVVERSLELRAAQRGELGLLGQELGPREERAQRGRDVAAARAERRRDRVDRRGRRSVGEEAPAELRRDVHRRRRMPRHGLEQDLGIALASARGDLDAEHALAPVVVLVGVELDDRLAEAVLVAHRPTGQTARGLHHVLLRVAAVHAERVQLEQLARVVLVRPLDRRALHVRASVEVPEHRRAGGRGAQELGETPERVLADHLAVVAGLEPGALALRAVDVEVVGPEFDEHFVELTLR